MFDASRIIGFIKKEGICGYVARILYGGVYVHWFIRRLNREKLKSRKIKLFGSYFFLSDRPGGLTEELQIYRSHEPMASFLYSQLLKGEETVLDIGSNVGYYAMVASRCTQKKSIIHCFEPDPELFDILEINNRLSGDKWILNKLAISDRECKMDFFRSKIANWGGVKPNIREKMDTIKVESVTIDGYCKGKNIRPTTLRMDIEGAEASALRGGKKTILEYRPKIFMELHMMFLSDEEREEMGYLLVKAGYNKCIVVKRYYDTPWSLRKFKYQSTIKDVLSLKPKKSDENVLSLFIF